MALSGLISLLAPAAALGAAVLDCGSWRVHQLELGQMSNYQYVVDNGKEAVSVDAAWDVARLQRYLQKQNLKLIAGLYTHGHFDHIGGSVP
ncbi:baeB, partial [Symbiodinium microadriaticum]